MMKKPSTDTTFSVMWTLLCERGAGNRPSCFPRHEILRAYAKLFKENVWNRFLKNWRTDRSFQTDLFQEGIQKGIPGGNEGLLFLRKSPCESCFVLINAS